MKVNENNASEVFAELNQDATSKLVDVRTQEEWQENRCSKLSYQDQLIKLSLTENFAEDLAELITDKKTKIFLFVPGV